MYSNIENRNDKTFICTPSKFRNLFMYSQETGTFNYLTSLHFTLYYYIVVHITMLRYNTCSSFMYKTAIHYTTLHFSTQCYISLLIVGKCFIFDCIIGFLDDISCFQQFLSIVTVKYFKKSSLPKDQN